MQLILLTLLNFRLFLIIRYDKSQQLKLRDNINTCLLVNCKIICFFINRNTGKMERITIPQFLVMYQTRSYLCVTIGMTNNKNQKKN